MVKLLPMSGTKEDMMASNQNEARTELMEENVILPKILIGVPILSWTHEFAESFLNFWTGCMVHKVEGRKFHLGYKFKYRRPVHMAEEELAEMAIASGCTHLLLMDDDIYDVDIQDLLKLLDADKDVISGIMYTSSFPHSMCAFRRFDTSKTVAEQPQLIGPTRLYEIPPDQRHGIVPVDLIPFGFTLIKTSVFQKIKKPWFTCNTQAPTDSWFMDSIMNSGIKPYAHFDVWLNHRGVTKHNQAIQVQLGLANKKAHPSNAIMLTPEEMEKHEIVMTTRIQEAEKRIEEQEIKELTFYNKQEGDKIAVPIKKEESDG